MHNNCKFYINNENHQSVIALPHKVPKKSPIDKNGPKANVDSPLLCFIMSPAIEARIIPMKADTTAALYPINKPETAIKIVSPSSIPRIFSPVLLSIMQDEISPIMKKGALIIIPPVILWNKVRLLSVNIEITAIIPIAARSLMSISRVSQSVNPITVSIEKKIQTNIDLALKSITVKVII